MTARRYTQAQINKIFAKAEAAADDHKHSDTAQRYVFILGYVSQSLGVPSAVTA